MKLERSMQAKIYEDEEENPQNSRSMYGFSKIPFLGLYRHVRTGNSPTPSPTTVIIPNTTRNDFL